MLLSGHCFGQTKTITGIVVDSFSHAPLANVSVGIKKGGHGVLTDREGKFTLHTDKNVGQLMVSAVGYQSTIVPLRDLPNQPLTILLPKAYTTRQAFVVKAKPGRYRNKNNPAVELIRKVIENKERNGPNGEAYTAYQEYEKIRLLLDKIPRLIAGDKLLKKYHFLGQN